MNKKMFGIFVFTLLLIATGVTVAGTLKQNIDTENEYKEGEVGASGWGWYNPAGAWMRSDKGLIGVISYVGWGKYAMSYEYFHDPTWPLPYYGTLFPTTVGVTDGRGEFTMTGKNKFSLLAIGYDEDYVTTYYSVYSGTSTLTSDNDMNSVFYIAFYTPDQDPFSEYEEPLYCFGPHEFSYERIPIVAPCGS